MKILPLLVCSLGLGIILGTMLSALNVGAGYITAPMLILGGLVTLCGCVLYLAQVIKEKPRG